MPDSVALRLGSTLTLNHPVGVSNINTLLGSVMGPTDGLGVGFGAAAVDALGEEEGFAEEVASSVLRTGMLAVIEAN